jgi:hypothetical protein
MKTITIYSLLPQYRNNNTCQTGQNPRYTNKLPVLIFLTSGFPEQ